MTFTKKSTTMFDKNKSSKLKMAMLISVYTLLMTFFLLEDQSIAKTIINNFYSLSIYKHF